MWPKGRLEYAYEYTPKCGRLLDVGCDFGGFTKNYLKKAKHVFGTDVNSRTIRQAAKNFRGNGRIKFKVAFAEKLPFPDSYFDVVTLTDTFEHVSNEKKTIAEIHRVLRPGGQLVFSVPYKGMFRFLDSFNMKFYFPRFYKWFKGDRFDPGIYEEAPWHRHYSLGEIERFFKGKFEIEKKHRGGLFLFPLCTLLSDSIFWKFKFPEFITKMNDWLGKADYSVPYGGLAYHVVLLVKCRK